MATSERRPLLATYRLQLHPGFGFDDAAAVVPYLAQLGVSHVYCSPYLQAAPGSTHGYDAIDPTRVSDDLGGPEAHRRFCDALAEQDLGQVLDIVPNHLAAVGANPWWWDVLENGRAARYARHFDIDWAPSEAKLAGQVLLPVLGDQYGRVLEEGQLTLSREGGTFVLHYFDHRFPISPRSVDGILAAAALRTGNDELAFLAHSLERLPPPTDDPQAAFERHRDKEVAARMLAALCEREPGIGDVIDDVLHEIEADSDAFHALLERQNYRLAHWKTAQFELDYRRFFDIATLVGLRIEDERVFRDVHGLVLGWLADGVLDGVRVDHPDGLRDPEQYTRRLRAAAGPDAWIVVEKILTGDETLPTTWPVDGTTGYDHLNRILWCFVDPEGLARLDAAYRAYTGEEAAFPEVALEAKLEVLRTLLAADVERITNLLAQVVERHRRVRDMTRPDLREALVEVAAGYDVYRTYVRVDEETGPQASDEDRDRIAAAVEAARARRPDVDPELLEFLRRVLSLEVDGDVEHAVAVRFQQLTSPATAKGVEDTAFYRYTRLLAVNEVGGEPDRDDDAVDAFHRANALAAERWPRTMLTTSTHDTKRSEDVRARLVLLSQEPERWTGAVAALDRRAEAAGLGLPAPGVRWWVWQLLAGAHPLDADRAATVVEKCLREAKQGTSWLRPDPDFEADVQAFVTGACRDAGVQAELDRLVADLADAAMATALGQVLLKLTSPGVPDIYQGTELWDLSLVDPDNRRPVDYDERAARLRDAATVDGAGAWARRADGLAKLFLVQRVLALRGRRPELFGPGSTYAPLPLRGTAADGAVAYGRGRSAGADEPLDLVVVVPRFAAAPARAAGTAVVLPDGRWHDVITGAVHDGGEHTVDALTKAFPVALLERERDAEEGGR